MTIAELTLFLGHVSAINIAVLFSYMLTMAYCRGTIEKIHSKMFGISTDELPTIYMEFLGRYKIMVIFFNLVPYIALIMIS